MDDTHSPANLKPIHQRLLHFLLGMMAMVAIPLLLIIGTIMITNLLTQLNHAQTWFYLTVCFSSVLVLGLCLILLYKFMRHQLKSAGIQIKSTKDL